MKTYSLDLRHAPSKRRLNALADNRFEPLKSRQPDDQTAIRWAMAELLDLAKGRRGPNYQYVEGALLELLPFGQVVDGKDFRRLGRWVCNADGLNWREAFDSIDLAA